MRRSTGTQGKTSRVISRDWRTRARAARLGTPTSADSQLVEGRRAVFFLCLRRAHDAPDSCLQHLAAPLTLARPHSTDDDGLGQRRAAHRAPDWRRIGTAVDRQPRARNVVGHRSLFPIAPKYSPSLVSMHPAHCSACGGASGRHRAISGWLVPMNAPSHIR